MSREFLMPGRIFSGENAAREAMPKIARLGKRALLVTGKIVRSLDVFSQFTGALREHGIEYKIFSEITGEPDDQMIQEGLGAYQANGCDFLIAVGGGSPIDAMKAIAAQSACGGILRDYMDKEICGRLPPMAAVPTTAGTGSEATKFTIITDSETRVKMLLKGDALIPSVAVADPLYTKDAPPSVTAATGLDALTHAVEAYTSNKAQPLTDAVALSAVKRIFKYLPKAYQNGNDLEARSELSIAALEAGIAINNASVTIVHGMSRPIGALFHVPHGLSNAMLLPGCMSFVKDGAPRQFAELGFSTGEALPGDSDEVAAEKFIAALKKLCCLCRVPTVCEFGIDKEEFIRAIDKMTQDAIQSGSPANTRKSVTAQDIIKLYQSLVD